MTAQACLDETIYKRDNRRLAPISNLSETLTACSPRRPGAASPPHPATPQPQQKGDQESDDQPGNGGRERKNEVCLRLHLPFLSGGSKDAAQKMYPSRPRHPFAKA